MVVRECGKTGSLGEVMDRDALDEALAGVLQCYDRGKDEPVEVKVIHVFAAAHLNPVKSNTRT